MPLTRPLPRPRRSTWSSRICQAIGGVGYLHIYSAREKEHKIVDYVALTPRAATLSLYDSDDKQGFGPLSPLVPGACGGWLAALERYGSMDAGRVFAPAIEYGEQGYALTVKNAFFYAGAAENLRRFKTGADIYLLDGAAPRPGEVVVQKALAETFRQVAAEGADVFYKGAIADRMVRYMEETGGLITKEDLADFAPAFVDPVSINYRGYEVFAPPPPCQAVQYLETLAIMEGFDVTGLGHNTTETLHRFIETTKLAMPTALPMRPSTIHRPQACCRRNTPPSGAHSSATRPSLPQAITSCPAARPGRSKRVTRACG